MMILRRFLNRTKAAARTYAVLEGERAYAIGDIHGRLDLLDRLLRSIDEDDGARASATTRLIFLGDLVNRGPESSGVVSRLMALREADPSAVFLKGNHEEILIEAYKGDRRSTALLHRVGGRETLMSYGVCPEEYERADLLELTRLMQRHIPEAHVRFLESFENWYVNGDYLFVHAGIRPRVPLDHQEESDLRWIRRDFLQCREDYGRMVIHGHSISTAVDEQPNRIGIDTGAYATGKLTAVGLEAADRWYLST